MRYNWGFARTSPRPNSRLWRSHSATLLSKKGIRTWHVENLQFAVAGDCASFGCSPLPSRYNKHQQTLQCPKDEPCPPNPNNSDWHAFMSIRSCTRFCSSEPDAARQAHERSSCHQPHTAKHAARLTQRSTTHQLICWILLLRICALSHAG